MVTTWVHKFHNGYCLIPVHSIDSIDVFFPSGKCLIQQDQDLHKEKTAPRSFWWKLWKFQLEKKTWKLLLLSRMTPKLMFTTKKTHHFKHLQWNIQQRQNSSETLAWCPLCRCLHPYRLCRLQFGMQCPTTNFLELYNCLDSPSVLEENKVLQHTWSPCCHLWHHSQSSARL